MKMENVQTRLACRKFWIYVAVTVIIIFLSGDFGCTCKPQQFDCCLHMTLPAFIIFVFILWTDRSFQRVNKHLFSGNWRHACTFWVLLLECIIRAAFIGLLWVVYVFLDGDWYVCCMNTLSGQQAQLPCKSVGWITDEEQVIITELQNKSRTIGSFLLFGIICVSALLSTLEWRKPSSSERRNQYYKLILEQQESVLKQMLRKSAQEQLRDEVENRIRIEEWEECFDIAEKLIETSATPRSSQRESE